MQSQISDIDTLVKEKQYCDCGTALQTGYSFAFKGEGNDIDPASIRCIDCSDAESFDEFCQSGFITSKLVMLSALDYFIPNAEKRKKSRRCTVRDFCLPSDAEGQRALELFSVRMDVAVAQFQGKVWFDANLREFVNKQSYGVSGKYKPDQPSARRYWPGCEDWNVDVRCFETAGRILIAFEVMEGTAKGTSVTFITDDSTFHRMGCQSFFGNTADILTLCNVALVWGDGQMVCVNGPPDFSKKLKADPKVSVG